MAECSFTLCGTVTGRNKKTRVFIELLLGRGMDETEIRTSGHADRDALLRMVEAVNPGKIVSIHTFDGDEYQSVFGHDRVLRIEDRQEVKID